jgi:hypothetical protein
VGRYGYAGLLDKTAEVLTRRRTCMMDYAFGYCVGEKEFWRGGLLEEVHWTELRYNG